MSTGSDYDGQRDERPTLPPIRDLFRDLRTPQDSPSLTLARLRVSDEVAGQIYSPGLPSSHVGSSHRAPVGHTSHSLISYPDSHLDHRSTSPLLNSHRSGGGALPGLLHPYTPYPDYGVPSANTRRRGQQNSMVDDPMTGPQPPYAPQEIPQFQSRQDSYNPRMPQYPSDISPQVHGYMSGYPLRPRQISTTAPSALGMTDEQTLIHPYGGRPDSRTLPTYMPKVLDDTTAGSAKYECGYCGKGFNRPSSLKIHLNSHTGEKPFICPVETCGRSFSVLSNMRRHARVHAQSSLKEREPSSEEESEQPSSMLIPHAPPIEPNGDSLHLSTAQTGKEKWLHHRGRSVSGSSISVHRNHGYSSEDEVDYPDSQAGNRIRHYQE